MKTHSTFLPNPALLAGACLALLTSAHAAEVTPGKPELTAGKAELMGRVEDFFMHNFRDISAKKSLEWSEPVIGPAGERSIRYTYEARIWDKKNVIGCQTFTFDKEGKFLRYQDADGYPKTKQEKLIDTTSKKGVTELVEAFFQDNFRDISSRETLEWGDLQKTSQGNVAIRYKYRARIWDKDTVVKDQVFTFSPKGEFVSVKDAK